MRRRVNWWLSRWVVGTALRPARGRWLVTVRFSNGAVLRNWMATEAGAQRQRAEAEQPLSAVLVARLGRRLSRFPAARR